MPRYRFSHYIVSPRRRVLLANGREQPLIPRYFDLLVFLIERRHEAVHRRDIFDRVWSDVIVSDSALSQAIRTIRRTLGDDPREPRFIRTVARHGYRFVYADVIEEEDDGAVAPPVSAPDPAPATAATRSVVPADTAHADPFEPLLERLTRRPVTADDREDQREAAELLHALGTAEALRRLDTRPHHAHARAILRDTRWDAPDSGDVPILGEPGSIAVATALVRLRLQRAAALAAARWAAGSIGGGLAGLIAGGIGGLLLASIPGGAATPALAPVLAVVGAVCGSLGGAGVSAGLSVAEAAARSRRAIALVAGGAIGGGSVGVAVQLLAGWSLAALVGLDIRPGGGFEGLTIGGAAGLSYALTTSRADMGLAAPRGRHRVRLVAAMAIACGAAALLITLTGRPLVGETIHRLAQVSDGAQATLAPLGRFVGEPDFGPLSRSLIGTGEGALFGLGVGLGLTRRPRRSR